MKLCFSRMLAASACIAAVLAASARIRAQPAQATPSLAGRWSLDFQLSQFPREIGFGADWMSGTEAGQGSTNSGGRGRGSSGGGGVNAWMARPESSDDAKRREILTSEVRSPPAHLTIVETSDAVTITNDVGQSRTFHPDAKAEVLHLDDVSVATTTKWEAGRLLIVYNVSDGRELHYTYSTVTNTSPAQLAVDVEFIERGGHDKVRRIYEPARAAVPPPAVGVTPSPSPEGTAAGAGLPAVAQGADAELKGLLNLGVVVEDLSPQATACGLKQDAIDTAVSKSLSDAGLRVRRNSDEDTYVYVDVITTSLSTGLCVSRYDVFLYSHTTAKLSYQNTSALVQVSLLHKGGIAGGTPAAHAEGVLRGVKEYVDQFAARIRNASR